MSYANKEDQQEYQRKHYLRNKKKYLRKSKENNKRYRARNREFIKRYKMSVGCQECGFKKHYAALDFHHMTDDKKDNIALMSNESFSLKRIKTEIRKCVVLCANCHRTKHCEE